jgi:hypothetical protein
MKVSVRDLLKNKYVLYLVALIAVIEVLGHLTVQDFEAVTIFVIAALLANYFSKNMIIVLGAGIVATTIFTATRVVKEGMKEGNNGAQSGGDDSQSGGYDSQSGGDDSQSGGENVNTPSCTTHTTQASCPSETCSWNQTSNTCGAKETFSTNNVPSSSPANVSGEEETEEETEKRIDYAATLEAAYDNLQGVLGDSGMKNLTSDTKSLINQQKQLMNTLKEIAPIMSDAQKTIGSFDMKELNNSMASIKGMLGKN